MSAIAVAEFGYTYCDYCTNIEQTDRECEACITKRWVGYMREWLMRAKTVAPGLTNAEVAVVERLISDLEAS